MDTATAVANLDEVSERFMKFKAGEGERPTDEEMKEALKNLRQSRAAAASTKKAKKKAPLSDEQEKNLLGDLFAGANATKETPDADAG